jgi:hypothetical protein
MDNISKVLIVDDEVLICNSLARLDRSGSGGPVQGTCRDRRW